MSRKNNLKYTIVDAVDGSVNFDTFNTPTNIDYLDNAGLLVSYTGNLVGTLAVFVSNDKAEENTTRLPVEWVELDFGVAVDGIDGTGTALQFNLNQLPYSWLAVSYTATSGTGDMTIKLTSKMLG